MNQELLKSGSFTFADLNEGNSVFIKFIKPLVVDWSYYKMGDEEMVFVDYDFGLTDMFNPMASVKIGWGYDGVNKDTPLEDIIKAFVKFDLFHAFFHVPEDPNYSHLHWALKGWLNNRVEVKETEI